MKKKLLIMVFALGLTLLVGCGQKFIKSGDTESKYAYGWTVNEDNTITVRIKDKWEKDCFWQTEYDEEGLYCKPGKKDGSFVVGSRNASVGELILRLYRQGQEDWEYSIILSLQGDGSGGVIVLSSTHEEPVKEGSYQYFYQDSSVIFMVNTSHLWLWRDMGENIHVKKSGSSEGIEQFLLSANATSVHDAMVQFYDTQAPLLLTVYADVDQNGVVNVTRIEESSDTDYGEKNMKLFWEQMGFTAPLSDAIEIQSADVINDDTDEIYAVGDLKVVIEGMEYDLLLSLLPRIVELSIPEGRIDPATGEWIPVNITEKAIGSDNVQFYQKESAVTAIWQHLGCNYVLKNRSLDFFTMEKAVATLMGVTTNE